MHKSIYKTFWGVHIDLDKIVAISDAYDVNATTVGFEIDFQLCDKPMSYRCPVPDRPTNDWYEDVLMPAVLKLQINVDELIAVWSKYKESQI